MDIASGFECQYRLPIKKKDFPFQRSFGGERPLALNKHFLD